MLEDDSKMMGDALDRSAMDRSEVLVHRSDMQKEMCKVRQDLKIAQENILSLESEVRRIACCHYHIITSTCDVQNKLRIIRWFVYSNSTLESVEQFL